MMCKYYDYCCSSLLYTYTYIHHCFFCMQLTNTLQKKLDQVKREKALLEQQIEREESSHGKLKTKLTSMMRTDKNQIMEKPKSDSNDNHKGTNHDSMVHSATILESEDEEADN